MKGGDVAEKFHICGMSGARLPSVCLKILLQPILIGSYRSNRTLTISQSNILYNLQVLILM